MAINNKEKNIITMIREKDINFKDIASKTNAISLAAVNVDGMNLNLVEDKTPEICLAAVKQNFRALKYVTDQTEDICLAAVEQDGFAIVFIDNPTENICLTAIENYIYDFEEYMKVSTEYDDLSLLDEGSLGGAIDTKEHHYAFLDSLDNAPFTNIENQTDKMSMLAVQKHPLHLYYVKNQTEEICIEAIKKDINASEYIVNLTPEIERVISEELIRQN